MKREKIEGSTMDAKPKKRDESEDESRDDPRGGKL
jgi:hypothetical protein